MQAEVGVESVIERVEVFRSQALVTRRANVQTTGLSGGLEVSLVGLPLGLLDDSVRLSLGEADGVRVVDVHLGWNLGQRDAKLRTKAHEKLRSLVRERAELDAARDREAARIQMLEALLPVNIPACDLPDTLAFGSRHQLGPWLDLAGYVRKQLTSIRDKRRDLERRRRDLLDQMSQARDELERESQEELEALAVLRKFARLQLELTRPLDQLELRLSYLIPGARWVPEYELRVMTGADEAELVLKALVAQRTGEAWDKSGLAFSTADLRRSTELPELDSWRIGKVQPARATGWRPLPEGLDELFESYDRGVRSLPAPEKTKAPSLPDMPRLGKAESVASTRRPSLDRLRDKLEMKAEDAEYGSGAALAAPEPEPVIAVGHEYDEEEKDYDGYDANEMEEISALDDMEMRMELPPPAPVAAAPMRSMAKEMKKKSRRRPAAKSMIADQTRAGGSVSGFALSEAPMEQAAFADLEMEAAGLSASRDALGYQDLRMQGPDGGSMRGQLKAVGLRDRLTEGLADAPDEIVDAVRGMPGEIWSRVIGSQAPRLSGLALPRHAVALDQSAGHFAVRYPMESLGSVPPDGQLHALTLLRRQGQVQRVFRCVPLLDDHVYQMVEFNNPLELPLLAGPVRVYRGGDYVVTSPLWTTPPGKTLTVNLGVEPDIVTARNVKFHESTEGLFGGDTALVHQVEIEVRSRLTQPARVEVFERVPTTHDEDIKVEIVKSTPKAEEYDQTDRGRPVRGGLRFGFELQPGKTVTCSLEYRITIPSKQVLVEGIAVTEHALKPIGDDDLNVDAPVRTVLVMEDRAQVTRRAEVTLEAGRNLLVVDGVTPLVADRTLRCRVRALDVTEAGGEPPRMLDASVRRRYLIRAARPESEQEIRTAIDSLVDEYRQVLERVGDRFHERTLVGRAADGLVQQICDRMVVGPFEPEWGEEVERVFTHRAGLEEEILADQWAQDDRRERLGRLVEELRVALKPVSDYVASLKVELWAPAGGRYGLEVEYQVPCALWRPSYSADLLEGEKDRVAWRSSGTVWQLSGEDWTDIELSFSTARPTLGAELPMMEDDDLRARTKTDHERKVVEVTSRDQVIAKTSDVPAEEQSDTPPGLDDGGEARTYTVPRKVAVPSDGRPHRLEFDRWEEDAVCELVCLPEKAEFVFLRSMQTNPSTLPQLAGPVCLNRNGGYVGRGQIRYVASGEKFELSWGSEDGLVVMREVDRDYEETSIRKRRLHDFHVEIYLANQTGARKSLRLVERVPVPEIEQVELEVQEKNTTPGFKRDEQGLLSWQVELEAGDEKRIELSYRVAMPHSVVWNG